MLSNLLFLCSQRKEKLLKKQHRQALLLDNFINVDGLGPGRSLRDRKPVTYTFGENNKIYLSIFSISCSASCYWEPPSLGIMDWRNSDMSKHFCRRLWPINQWGYQDNQVWRFSLNPCFWVYILYSLLGGGKMYVWTIFCCLMSSFSTFVSGGSHHPQSLI